MQYISEDSAQGVLVIHPRIMERHPEIAEDDVRHAWDHMLKHGVRTAGEGTYVAIGLDKRGRVLEVVAKRKNSRWIAYHALTPPTKKTLKELRIG